MDMQQLWTQKLISCPTWLAGSSAGLLKSEKMVMPDPKFRFALFYH
jgi:hypothetical protein